MEIGIALLALLVAIIALLFQLKQYWKKNKIPKFSGRIGVDANDGKQTGNLFNFVNKNEGKIVFIDIYFDNDEHYKLDKNGIFLFSYYFDINEKLNGGFEYRIKVKDSDDFFYDGRFSSKRLKGYFKILGFSGPQMGWITKLLKPVHIESV
ncbi:MAG TPA: hypothetical protein VFM70_06885 [Salinimicrobium sp.]|nr:hypothetical protein [Salinimicrobium sp.]